MTQHQQAKHQYADNQLILLTYCRAGIGAAMVLFLVQRLYFSLEASRKHVSSDR